MLETIMDPRQPRLGFAFTEIEREILRDCLLDAERAQTDEGDTLEGGIGAYLMERLHTDSHPRMSEAEWDRLCREVDWNRRFLPYLIETLRAG